MAKYAVGYVLALLMLAVVGLAVWTGGGTVRLPWQSFGGGVDIGRPMPIPAVPVPAPMPEVISGPPDLIVTDAEGTTRLSPMSFCWSSAQSSMCSESDWLQGSEPVFVATDEQRVTLDFQMFWDVDLVATPVDSLCPPFEQSLTETWDLQVELGGAGEYLVTVNTATSQGDARWVLRIDNQVGEDGC